MYYPHLLCQHFYPCRSRTLSFLWPPPSVPKVHDLEQQHQQQLRAPGQQQHLQEVREVWTGERPVIFPNATLKTLGATGSARQLNKEFTTKHSRSDRLWKK